MMMGSTTDFKTGLTIEFEGSVWKVTEFLHVKPGKGPAFVRSKLKNLENGNTLEKTWKAGETFPDAQVDKASMLFSYTDGDDHVFMNMETFEEERIKSATVRHPGIAKCPCATRTACARARAPGWVVPIRLILRVHVLRIPFAPFAPCARRTDRQG